MDKEDVRNIVEDFITNNLEVEVSVDDSMYSKDVVVKLVLCGCDISVDSYQVESKM